MLLCVLFAAIAAANLSPALFPRKNNNHVSCSEHDNGHGNPHGCCNHGKDCEDEDSEGDGEGGDDGVSTKTKSGKETAMSVYATSTSCSTESSTPPIPTSTPTSTATIYPADGKLHHPMPAPYMPAGGLGTNGTEPVYKVKSDFDYESLVSLSKLPCGF